MVPFEFLCFKCIFVSWSLLCAVLSLLWVSIVRLSHVLPGQRHYLLPALSSHRPGGQVLLSHCLFTTLSHVLRLAFLNFRKSLCYNPLPFPQHLLFTTQYQCSLCDTLTAETRTQSKHNLFTKIINYQEKKVHFHRFLWLGSVKWKRGIF